MVAAHLEQLYFRFGFRNVALFRVKKRKNFYSVVSLRNIFIISYYIYFFNAEENFIALFSKQANKIFFFKKYKKVIIFN